MQANTAVLLLPEGPGQLVTLPIPDGSQKSSGCLIRKVTLGSSTCRCSRSANTKRGHTGSRLAHELAEGPNASSFIGRLPGHQ